MGLGSNLICVFGQATNSFDEPSGACSGTFPQASGKTKAWTKATLGRV